MKKRLASLAVTAWLLAPLPAFAAPQPQVKGCPYIAPPADSLVVEGNHHLPGMSIWPRVLPPGYSGCTYIWFGTRLHSIARWKDAQVIDGVMANAVEGIDDDSDLPPMVYCRKAVDDQYSDCGRFTQTWRVEFPTMIEEINALGKR